MVKDNFELTGWQNFFILCLFVSLIAQGPNYLLINDDTRYSFCKDHSIDNADFNECFEVTVKQSYQYSAIMACITIISAVYLIITIFSTPKSKNRS